jgi:polyhydroxybutyrate depolymerase
MKKYLLPLIIAFSLCCSRKDEPTSTSMEKGLLKNQAINVAGLERNYHLYVPDNPLNAPIVLLFHGNGGSHNDMLGLTGIKAPYKIWLEIAQKENLILIVPNGTLGSSNSRGWNDCRADAASNPTVDDVFFTNKLLDDVIAKYKANSAKVYAVGTSNGGHFAIRLAQEIPHRIAAFAAVVAANAKNSQCNNSLEKVSALIMNGTADPILPYRGGQVTSNRGEVLPTENAVSYWVQRNATSTTPDVTTFPDINTTDGSTVTKHLYKNGGNGTEVAFYKVQGGGHTEPSIAERYGALFLLMVGTQNGDIEMAHETWSFFRTKTK